MGVIVPSFRQEGISSSDRIRLKILYSHLLGYGLHILCVPQ